MDATSLDPVEQRRERQRQHAKRSYYKRVKAMTALKLERDVLEKQYREALAAQQSAIATGGGSDEGNGGGSSNAVSVEDANAVAGTTGSIQQQQQPDLESEGVQRVMELSKARDKLREQNKELQRAIARFFTLQRRLQQSMEDLENEFDLHTDAMLAASLADDGSLLMSQVLTQEFERVVLTKPLTSEECNELNRKTHKEMVTFLKGSGGGYSTAGTNLCGWQEYRNTHNGRFRFSTHKLFPRRTAAELSSRTWEIVSSVTEFRELYSSNISMQVDLVQRVDDDNVLLYRTVQIPNSTKVSKSLPLASRFHCSSGHVVLLRSFDKSRCRPAASAPGSPSVPNTDALQAIMDDSNSIWTDVFIWAVFSEEGTHQEHCMMEFGGFVMNATVEMAEFWMLEALLISLRWENRVVGPIFKAL